MKKKYIAPNMYIHNVDVFHSILIQSLENGVAEAKHNHICTGLYDNEDDTDDDKFGRW